MISFRAIRALIVGFQVQLKKTRGVTAHRKVFASVVAKSHNLYTLFIKPSYYNSLKILALPYTPKWICSVRSSKSLPTCNKGMEEF